MFCIDALLGPISSDTVLVQNKCMRVRKGVRVCVHARTYVRGCVYVCVNACMRVHMRVHMCVCTHARHPNAQHPPQTHLLQQRAAFLVLVSIIMATDILPAKLLATAAAAQCVKGVQA